MVVHKIFRKSWFKKSSDDKKIMKKDPVDKELSYWPLLKKYGTLNSDQPFDRSFKFSLAAAF